MVHSLEVKACMPRSRVHRRLVSKTGSRPCWLRPGVLCRVSSSVKGVGKAQHTEHADDDPSDCHNAGATCVEAITEEPVHPVSTITPCTRQCSIAHVVIPVTALCSSAITRQLHDIFFAFKLKGVELESLQ